MKYIFGSGFPGELEDFPEVVRKKFWKQLDNLLRDIRHPSLHAKRYDELRGIWQARVDRNVRFYFLIERDYYVLLRIRKHPK